MRDMAPVSFDEFQFVVAMARLILGPDMNVQAPPNLTEVRFGELLDAGINDWGGVSPLTVDHINPEAQHFALCYDGEKMRYYVNGSLQGEADAVGPLTRNRFPLYVGADPMDRAQRGARGPAVSGAARPPA